MAAASQDWRKSWRVWIPTFLVLLVFALALVAIQHMLATVTYADVVAEFKSISPAVVLLAMATTALGYLSMVGYDWTALKFIGKKIPLPTIVVGSFTGYALGNTIGLSVVSGGLARYRVYSAHGLDGTDVAVVSGISAASLGAGVLIVALGGVIIDPAAIQPVVGLGTTTVRWLASVAALMIIIVAGWLLWKKETLELAGHEIPVPPPQLLGMQLVCALLDVFFAGVTLYILLPQGVDIALPVFLVVYAVAVVAAALSHVPGGVGVFEMVIIGALGADAPLDGITSALIAYRIIYFLAPFGLALIIIAAHEALLRRQKLAGALAGGKQKVGSVASGLSPLVPDALAAMVFLAGLLLVVSGVMPIPHVASDAASYLGQLAFTEVSTIASGIFGMALVLVAFGLRRKIRAAYVISLVLLAVGAASIFVQRGAWWPAFVLLTAVGILYVSRAVFNRDSRLSYHVFSPSWFGLLAMVVLTAAFLGFFVHKDAAYSHDTWWQFTFDGHLPRYLRAGTAIAIVAFLSVLWFALQPVRLRISVDISEDQQTIEDVIQAQGQPDAQFVFTSDKSVLLNDNNTAFIMYAAHGKYWVALGDPIGEQGAFSELINEFISLAEQHNCKAVFYQVSDEYLPEYLDVGFVLSKLGEEAVVPLPDFGLEGRQHRSLRAAHNRSVRAGLSFEITQPPHSQEFMEHLRAISDEWLVDKHVREKSFSLGRFDVDYLQRFPIALVKKQDDIVAFANVLVTDAREGSTVDLMRHTKQAPNGTMEFLFVELMLVLKEQGYGYFSLGLAPLSGLSGKHIKKAWDRFGMVLYRFGGHFYNFDGLRMFKEKFRPEWHSRYLASGGGASPLLSLRAVNALIAGSLKGALTK